MWDILFRVAEKAGYFFLGGAECLEYILITCTDLILK